MTTITFYTPVRFARTIQLLVMQYDGRFVQNPFAMFTKMEYKVSFDNNQASKLMTMAHILNQPWV